jgi:glyoxylase-like metal-dependent hydrolase (beta-lactamase superfamily II)
MVDSLSRLAGLPLDLRVLPGHGQDTTIERERPWLQMVASEKRLPF